MIYPGNVRNDIRDQRRGKTDLRPVESKITSQGQVTVPAPIRRKLNLAPGSRIEWRQQEDDVIVRRAAKYSSLDIHEAVFATVPDRRSLQDMDEGIGSRMRRKYARR